MRVFPARSVVTARSSKSPSAPAAVAQLTFQGAPSESVPIVVQEPPPTARRSKRTVSTPEPPVSAEFEETVIVPRTAAPSAGARQRARRVGVVDRDGALSGREAVPRSVGRDRAQVVVAVGAGDPGDAVRGAVGVGADRRPGSAACRPALEGDGRDAGACVGRARGDRHGSADRGAVGRRGQRARRVGVVRLDRAGCRRHGVPGRVGRGRADLPVAVGRGPGRPGDGEGSAVGVGADRRPGAAARGAALEEDGGDAGAGVGGAGGHVHGPAQE